jgi:hypothetical protein
VEKQKNLTNISTKYSENDPSCSESLNLALITGEQGGSKLCVVGTKGSYKKSKLYTGIRHKKYYFLFTPGRKYFLKKTKIF